MINDADQKIKRQARLDELAIEYAAEFYPHDGVDIEQTVVSIVSFKAGCSAALKVQYEQNTSVDALAEIESLRAENAELKKLQGDIEHYQLITSILEFDKINIQKRLTAATAQLEKMAQALDSIRQAIYSDKYKYNEAANAIAQYEQFKKELK